MLITCIVYYDLTPIIIKNGVHQKMCSSLIDRKSHFRSMESRFYYRVGVFRKTFSSLILFL